MTKASRITLSILSVVLLLLFLSPVVWMILCSFKPDMEIFRYPPTFFPQDPTVQAYLDQFRGNYLMCLKNSLIIAGSSMAISLVLSIPGAYGLARFRIRFKKGVILGFLITQMLPPALLLTPMFLLYTTFGIINTQLAPIFSTVTLSVPFVIIFMRPFFSSLPKAIEESARIDGCSLFSAFIKIIVPVAKPGIFTTAIFSFIFPWSDLVYSLSFMSDASKWPMTTMMSNFISKYGTKWNSVLAFAVCLIIPVLIMFVFMQKYIITGLTAGAVKE